MTQRLLVIGGDAAGMSAASQARRRRGADRLEIVALEKGPYVSYSACGLPYYVGGLVSESERLIARRPETFRDRFQIDVRMRHEAVEIDLNRPGVKVRNLESGKESWEGYDHLVVATGAVAIMPDFPGGDAEGIFFVRTIPDADRIRAWIDDKKPRRAVVAGGGYIGIEMVENLCERGLEVTLVDMTPHPMPTLDPDMGDLVAQAMQNGNVETRLGETVEGFEVRDGRVAAVRTSKGMIDADLVIVALGVRPNSGLAADAGIETGEKGGIVTDRRMATPCENVWAAGDCVQTFNRVSQRPVYVALGTHANKQGGVIGRNIAGEYATFPGVLGTAITKVFECEIARTGLSEKEATAAGFEFVAHKTDSTIQAGYMPGVETMTTKLVAEKGTGRLLGAQIVGHRGAAKRIDALALALWNEMTLDELIHADLSYAPPFSPLWDPILIAARVTLQAMNQSKH